MSNIEELLEHYKIGKDCAACGNTGEIFNGKLLKKCKCGDKNKRIKKSTAYAK